MPWGTRFMGRNVKVATLAAVMLAGAGSAAYAGQQVSYWEGPYDAVPARVQAYPAPAYRVFEQQPAPVWSGRRLTRIDIEAARAFERMR